MYIFYETDYPEDFPDVWVFRLVGPVILLGHQDKLHCHTPIKAFAGKTVYRARRNKLLQP